MLEIALEAARGGFHLEVSCRLESRWTVVFGPSGSGKSTLLRLVAGLDRPRRGRVTLEGETLTDTGRGIHLRPGLRRTGLVAQQAALFPHMSVAANVAYGLASLDPPARAARVEEVLTLVDAAPLRERRPGSLSGGEAQRVALARALAPIPRLLILDEPFSALDGAASDALLERLEPWLGARRVLILLATHDATDAYATGAQVALMREGRLAALGPAERILGEERARILSRLGQAPRC